MARIAGVDLPREKRVEIGLTYIYGIGLSSSQKILKEANSSLDDVVKAQIFLTDINDFSKVSPIRNKYFANSKPVSTLVEVNSLVKKGCKIEIEVIAIKEN